MSEDIDRLARIYTKVRGAHNLDDYGADRDPNVQPCRWCVLAAEQHIEAAALADIAPREVAPADKPTSTTGGTE